MSQLTPPVNDRDHTLGDPSAPVSLVEYGDYECPFCGLAHRVVQALLAELGSSVIYAFRDFPLAQAHPHALVAAEAAEAAGAQDAFWPMHHLLYENQAALEPRDLVRYAVFLKLDVERFTNDLQNHVYLQKVKSDFRSGARSGVNGTPTFFINGERWDEGWDHPTLRAGIIQHLHAATPRKVANRRR